MLAAAKGRLEPRGALWIEVMVGDTPVQIIGEIRPDILVKGGDYDMDKLPETALVKSWGGRALALPFVQGYSTTKLVQRIRAG